LAAEPRLRVAASLLLEGADVASLSRAYCGERFAPATLDRATLAALATLEGCAVEHPEMPDAVRFELPDWLLPLFAARFGDALAAEMAALALPAPLDLRVNLLKATREEAQAMLAADDVEAAPTPLSPWGLRVFGRTALGATKAFRSGVVEIQDEGSQLVAALVGAAPGMRVADWCAGAGGKTLAMAMTMGNRGQIVACDISLPRLEGAIRRLRRAGVDNVERHLIQQPDETWATARAGSFDRVLVDAPCTGTGTWRRNPDARRRLARGELAGLLLRQAAILAAAARLVRTGGRLVYATCSLLSEENEAQVSAFLARQPGYALVPLSAVWPLDAVRCRDPYLALTPRRHGTDGFFGAVLERVA
ncbi:MAG: RsmB/NOP family class I SAM-dependent RNA methyltransferase, partial [Acetobacteraceae bacterium]|nr:RsmB/NOP family class I SAM-dependent RNA methyltransferase [Acetobacteraceae bacterium]